jgi:RHS repeat-associated protein
MLREKGRMASWGRRAWLGIAAFGVFLAACSSDQGAREIVGSASQALTSVQQRVLGFEAVGSGSTDWTTSSGTLSQSARHADGSGSLAIAHGGNATITSAALSSLGAVANKISVDLLLPAAQPNPNWMGTLKVVIECPSQQLWYEGLAEYQLQGKATEQFLRFEFPLSASTQQKLSTGTYSDLRFKILLNVADGVGPWLLDRLWVTASTGGGAGGAGGSSIGGSGGTGSTAGVAGSAAGSAGVSSANDSILGFENSSQWSTSSGVLASSATHLEGQRSVQVSGVTYAELTSSPLTTLSSVGPVVGFDISVPNPAGDVWWWGSAAISIDCPSRGLYGRWLGQQQLDGSTLGRFRRVEVVLPDDVKTALTTGSYSDLRVKVILTVPQGSGPYLLDRFTFAHLMPEPAPPGPSDALTKAIGFETLEAWKASSGTLSLSNNAIEGTSSLAASGFTYAEVTSQRLSSLGSQINGPVSFNIWVPTPPNQWWAGTVALSLDLPSKGIYSQWIAQQDLLQLAPNTWHRVSFNLPQSTVLALRGSYDDLRLKLILNRPDQPNAVLLDELTFGNLVPPLPSSIVEDYVIPLPKGMSFANVAVGQALIKRSGFATADLLASTPTFAGAVRVLTPFQQIVNAIAPRMTRTGGDASVSVGPWTGDVSAFLDVNGGPVTGTATAGRSVTATATTARSSFNLESFEAGRIHVEYPADIASRPDVASPSSATGPGPFDLAPGDYGFVRVEPVSSTAPQNLRLHTGVYHLRALSVSNPATILLDNAQGPIFIHVKDSLALGGGSWQRSVPSKNNVILTFAGRTLPSPFAFDGTLVAPRVDTASTVASVYGVPLSGSVFARSVNMTDSRQIGFRPFQRDDCATLPNAGCGVFGCDTADADADGLYDCEEHAGQWSDPSAFNGVHVRASAACTATAGDLCSSIDSLAKVTSCASAHPSLTEQNMYAGWALGGSALKGIGCQDEYDFWPPWAKCSASSSAAFDYDGFIQLKESGKHCFALPAVGSVCGSLFLNGATAGVTTASGAQCFDLSSGVYPIRWFIHAAQANPSDQIKVAYCLASGASCEPIDAIPQAMLRPVFQPSGSCGVDADCVPSQHCNEGHVCADCVPRCDGKSCLADDGCGHSCPGPCEVGSAGCQTDADCAQPLVCAPSGASFGLRRGVNVCTLPGCLTDRFGTGCGYDGAPCGACDDAVACAANTDCPAGDVCEQLGGSCVASGCSADPVATGCGTVTDPCGVCSCTPSCDAKSCGDDSSDGCLGTCKAFCGHKEGGCLHDSDCPAGDACVIGSGPRVGLAAGTNVCLPQLCTTPNLQVGRDCGDVSSTCGLCSEIPEAACAGRECGLDPSSGKRCGPDGPGCIQGKLVGAFNLTSFDLKTIDRDEGTVRTIEPLPAPHDEELTVGAVDGAFEVNQRGNAIYSIPINVPPGRAGLEPHISLVYNSASGNGLVGMGWTIGGLSAISRCPKTSATDGWASRIKFDDSDALCLDGQRLVWVSGSSSLTSGAVYRTELDSFDKIELVSEEIEGTDEVFFRDFRKDGLIYEYGRTDRYNERTYRDVPTKGRVVRSWALSRIRDRVGNFINIEYGKSENAEPRSFEGSVADTLELFPASIAYGGIASPRGDVVPSRVVTFDYNTDRKDYMDGFTSSGSRTTRKHLLTAIRTRVFDQDLRSYELGYELAPSGVPDSSYEASGPNRLKAITECSLKNGGRSCKPPSTFTYTDQRGFHQDTVKTALGGTGQLRGPLIKFDYNGDGAEDLLAAYDTGNKKPYWVVLAATGERVGGSYKMIVPQTAGDHPGFLFADKHCFSQQAVDDMNGDGRDDLLDTCRRSEYNFGTYDIWEGTGDEHSPLALRQVDVDAHWDGLKAPRAFLVDVDGDGVKDLFECGVKSTYDASQDPNPYYVERALYYRGRLNGTFVPTGSGVTSRVAKKRGDLGEGSLWSYCFDGPHYVGAGQPTPPMLVTDITGDGVGDLLLWKPAEVAKPGGSLVDTSAWGRYVVEPDGETAYWDQAGGGVSAFQLLDVNGDGLPDWLSKGSGVAEGSGKKTEFFQVALNIGGAFGPPFPASVAYSDAALIAHRSDFGITHSVPLDYDGDGAQDLVHLFQPRSGDPAGANSLWLWDRTTADAAHHGSLELDPALRDLNDPSLRALSAQPNVTPPAAGPIFTMADADGDGSADLVQLGSDGKLAVTYGQFGYENLLRTATNGVGKRIQVRYDNRSLFSDGTSELTYKTDSACSHVGGRSTRCLKQVGPLVSQYQVVADPGSQAPVTDLRVHYRYENARQGLFGRGWLGFEKTTIEKVQPRSQEQLIEREEISRDNRTFDSRWKVFPFAGLPTRQVTTTAFEQSKIEKESAAGQADVSQEWAVGRSASGGPFPFVRTTTSSRNEVLESGVVLNVSTKTSTSLTVDAYGNVQSSNESTSVSGVTQVFRTHVATFDLSDTRINEWLIGLKLNQVDGESIFRTDSDKPDEVRETSWTYDDLGLLSSATREPTESPNSSLRLQTTYRRRSDDVFQNVRSVEVTGNWQDGGSDPVLGRRVQSYQYDDQGMFVRRVVRHVGDDCPVDDQLKDDVDTGFGTTCMLVDTTFDPRDATLLGRVDETGVGMQSAYDAFGRVRRTVSAAETKSFTYAAAEASYDAELRSVPATTQMSEFNETTGASGTKSFDALGRTVQTETSGLDGEPIFQETRYNLGSRVDTISRPHLDGDASQGHIAYGYDRRWRLTERDFPNNTSAQVYQAASVNVLAVYAPRFSEVTTTVKVDPKLNQIVELTDFRGNLLRSRDAKGTTEYTYDAFGTLGRISDANGNITEIETDRLARVISHDDADTGLQTYQYTAFDEPFIHEDGVGTAGPRKRIYQYDTLGRLAEVTAPEGDTLFTYDVGENAKGRLVETTAQTPSSSPQVQHFEYQPVPDDRDPMSNLAFVQQVSQQTAGSTFATTYQYDAQNQLERVEYPSSMGGKAFAVRYGYDSVGSVNRVTGTNAEGTDENALFWSRESVYQGQAVETETLGDQLTTSYAYEANTGRLKGITTAASASDVVQDIQFLAYDDNGNVTHRTTAIKKIGSSDLETVDEGFDYDELDRLDHVRIGGVTTQMAYDAIGNITSKPGVGSYNYLEAGKQFRPHAVQNVSHGNATVLDFQYDDFGNVTYRSGEGVVGESQQIEYTSFNLPAKITLANGQQVKYEYDASEARVLASSGDCSTQTAAGCGQRIYVGQGYEQQTGTDTTGSFTRHVYKVSLGRRQLAEVTREDRGDTEVESRRYVHSDAQGSPQVVTDDSGAVVASLRHGPFGERVAERGDASSLGSRSDFTGHDLDEETGLVNMGGRLYDARLGRFMQADPPGMESLYGSRGLNRYTYVFNNPTNLVDPSGFDGQDDGGWTGQDTAYPEIPYTQQELNDWMLIREAMATEHPFAEANAEDAQANALWEIINGEGSEAMHGPTGNPNMDLIGLPTPSPSPQDLDTRARGPGDKFNPYDNHRFGTSLFGQEHARDPFPWARPGGFLYELSPESDIIALMDDHASGGRKAVAIISLLPLGKIAKLGKIGGEAVKGAEVAFGLSRTVSHAPGLLGRFAENVGARTYWDFFENTTDLRLLGERTLTMMDEAQHIHVNLSGMIDETRTIDDVVRWGGEGIGQGNVTNWEVYQIVSDPDRLSKTTFYLNGAPFTF